MAVRPVQGTTDVLQSSDNNNVVAYFSGSAVAVTLPAALPKTFRTTLLQIGAGIVTLTPSSGVVANTAGGGALATAEQWEALDVVAYGQNAYDVVVNGAGGGGGGISLQNAGTPLAGGPFSTLNLASGATATDAGGGVADVAVSGGGGSAVGPAGTVQMSDGAGAFEASESGVSLVAMADADGDGNPGMIFTAATQTLTISQDGTTLRLDSATQLTMQADAGNLVLSNNPSGAQVQLLNTGDVAIYASGSQVIYADGASGAMLVGSPTGPDASAGDANISGDYKKNGVIVLDGTDAAGAQVGTLTNAPTAGNPAKFIRVMASDGTIYAVPGWAIP